MEIDVRTAKMREKPIVENLMQLYLHDYSAFEALQLDKNGQYRYESLDQYWQNPNRYPFLFRVDNELVGFALVRYDMDLHTMLERRELVEFFVLRSHRREGIGTAAAIRLWNLFPGHWQLRVIATNAPALAFWRKLLGEYTRADFQEMKDEGMVSHWINFAFQSRTPSVSEDEVPTHPVDD